MVESASRGIGDGGEGQPWRWRWWRGPEQRPHGLQPPSRGHHTATAVGPCSNSDSTWNCTTTPTTTTPTTTPTARTTTPSLLDERAEAPADLGGG